MSAVAVSAILLDADDWAKVWTRPLAVMASWLILSATLFTLLRAAWWLSLRLSLPPYASVAVAGVLAGIGLHWFVSLLSEGISCGLGVDFPYSWVEGCPTD